MSRVLGNLYSYSFIEPCFKQIVHQLACNMQRPKSAGVGHSQKIGDGDAWPHWPPFSNSLSTIDPLFWLAISPNDPLFVIIHQFLTISHWITPLFKGIFCQIFIFFLAKMCPNLYFALKIAQNLSNSHRWCPSPPPFGLHCMTTFFGDKDLTKRPLVLSCCLSTPFTFNVECSTPWPISSLMIFIRPDFVI